MGILRNFSVQVNEGDAIECQQAERAVLKLQVEGLQLSSEHA